MKQIEFKLSDQHSSDNQNSPSAKSKSHGAPITAPITYIKGFLSRGEQQQLLADADSYPFEKPIITLFGKQHPIPRAQVWFAAPGCEYQYSSLLISPQPWPHLLADLRQRLRDELQFNCNGVLVNRYQNGLDSMGWHSDDEPEIVANSAIVSVSIGASRTFALRHKSLNIKQNVELESGDLLIMHQGMQSQWQHAVPKRLKVKNCRLNLTFRQLIVGYHQLKG
ncbi:hypothetical protein BCU94_04870 [Shewanella sp. 10N.286.52.C2]|uniref:alpha-ketoglutarate-dependent dioxygenase AlkB family protein n=1 Tax=Shewanella sp. 10N.286.52.C2 TaxID=1880838 RepID=UPI000CC20ACB|nr:alpha-ketoglutarate-dependent dioxygenase AlkB [Shewanella sp. 10N.286.52.C2]PMG26911.1 hypothetical protein BCU94_04870 [Shewanella sp. 10N.286.52.C2]